MSLEDIDFYFAEYVGKMQDDIAREIDWASQGKFSGNFLCALGLLVYTEALGRIRRANFDSLEFRLDDDRENFEAMFDALDGGNYGFWRVSWEAERLGEASIYEVLRCGMAHEYLPKVRALVHMGAEMRRGIDYVDGRLAFYVVPYFLHFSGEAKRLHDELKQLPVPYLPEPHRKWMNAPVQWRPTTEVVSGSSVASGADLGVWHDKWTELRPKREPPKR